MFRSVTAFRGLFLSAALVLVASCGDDSSASPDATTAPAADATADTTGAPAATSGAASAHLPDACAIVPTTEVAAALGVAVDEGVPAGDERRRVCTFLGTEEAIGVTVGIEPGARFEEKAEASQQSLGVDGVEVDGLGDRALFFYSDADIPEGVGGTLVAVGDLTIDVTLQGLEETALRDASVGIATLAVTNI